MKKVFNILFILLFSVSIYAKNVRDDSNSLWSFSVLSKESILSNKGDKPKYGKGSADRRSGVVAGGRTGRVRAGSKDYRNKKTREFKIGLWNISQLNGEVKAKALYREQQREGNGIKDNQTSKVLSGGILLNSKSYIWHPSFILIDANAEYNPETSRDNYIIVPDRSEVRNLARGEFKLTFLDQKPINFGVFTNLSESFNNRENMTNLKSSGRTYGAFANYLNSIVPVTANLTINEWTQKELPTGRSYFNSRNNLVIRANKSFSTRDRHELVYTHDRNVNKMLTITPYTVSNSADNVRLNNSVAFDRQNKYLFTSALLFTDQLGNDTYTKFQANERLSAKLPQNFKFTTSYNYLNLKRPVHTFKQQTMTTGLSHQLFESLYSGVFYEFNDIDHSLYEEGYNRFGGEVKYTKKLPLQSQFSVGYKYYRQLQGKKSDESILPVFAEAHTLLDGDIVLLSKPYINISSIVVKDLTGVIIYQENIDYLLIQRDKFIEIQRISGGQIANGAKVYVDYISTQPGTYNYELDNQNFTTSISFYNRLIEVYYTIGKQNYFNLDKTDFLTLNYYTQHIVGVKAEYKMASAGVEFDDYRSSIIPYKMTRYFANLQGDFKQKIIYAINGNYREYRLVNENLLQKFADISGKLSFPVLKNLKLDVEFGYRNQIGKGIDLEMFTSRGELVMNIKKLYFTLGADFYKRNYIGEKINFNSAYVQLSRKF